jgi:hypothetical protein
LVTVPSISLAIGQVSAIVARDLNGDRFCVWATVSCPMRGPVTMVTQRGGYCVG